MPGSTGNSPQTGTGAAVSLGQIYPGGTFQIVSNSIANPTVVTTLAPHGLTSGDVIFFTASTTSSPALTATPRQVVTVISSTTFSVPVNVTVGGTAGAYDIAVTSIPVTAVGVPATVNFGSAHGLRIGDTFTPVATGASATVGGSLDAALTVTAVPSTTSVVVGAFTNVTTPGSTTAGHATKTTFNSDVWDSQGKAYQVGVLLTSVIGTAPVTTKVDIQGSLDHDPIKQAAGTVNGTWFNLPYAIITAPQTLAVAQLTVTTGVSTVYKIAAPGEANYMPYRYLRFAFSSSTNIVMTPSILALPRG
jgi:hypothetical protein